MKSKAQQPQTKEEAMASYQLPELTGKHFVQDVSVPHGAPKVLVGLYVSYKDECRAERVATWSFREWFSNGCLSLREMHIKWHQDYVADMKSKYGPDWKPETEEVDGDTGEVKTKKSKGAKAFNPNRGSTKKVWVIADGLMEANKGQLPERKAVIAACSAQGINPGTAQVQFGKWKKERFA